MKITKYLHSCLLIEEQDKTILIDPGNYTYDAKVLNISKLKRLDYLLITHEHQDHFHLPFIKEIMQRFPHIQIITNPAIVSLLARENITGQSNATDFLQIELVTHEKLWDKMPPQNAVFKIFDKLTHPGDSLHFVTKSPILALPLQAPWGSTNEAVNKALAIKPKYIIPIHDWHWKEEVRKGMYERLTDFFATQGITFKGLETGESVEI